MRRFPLVLTQKTINLIKLLVLFFIATVFQLAFYKRSAIIQTFVLRNPYSTETTNKEQQFVYRRQSCSCTRPLPKSNPSLLIIDETSSTLCSRYSTLRGFHQRIISISMHEPRNNSLFTLDRSINFLYNLIDDMTKRYPDWILRIYHDLSIKDDIICSIECAYNHVDFCNTSSLGNLGSLSSYIPAKIWRFLPVGDELVDIMASRVLDSPITKRELDAVNAWISSGKAWHTMRDHPNHTFPMLGGMWGFRPALNRSFASSILQKILDRSLVTRYRGRRDQTFLTDIVWPHIQDHVIAHDSFLCESFGNNSRPWPTRRPHPLKEPDCYVGCVRPCCISSEYLFDECPMACRPQNHTDWTMC